MGGSGGSENQSVSGVTTICLTQSNTSPSHRVDQVVDCGLWDVVEWSCWILSGTGARCRICRSRASQTCSMGDMSGECAGHARTGMFSTSRNCVQILATWGRVLSCCNMRWWSWMNGDEWWIRRSCRWRCWMWRSWAGYTCLRLWGRLEVMPNSLKFLWRRLMVEKWTFNYLATALVDIPAVSMPITRSLKICDICGIVLCDKTAHFREDFYCVQCKTHLCNNHAV